MSFRQEHKSAGADRSGALAVLSSFLVCNFFGRSMQHAELCSGRKGLFGDLIPHLELSGKFGAVGGGGDPVAGWAKVWRDATERGQKPLR